MIIHDRAYLTSRERTPEGYLKVRARLSRTGVQDYYRGEIGLDGDPRETIRIYRPAEEVFGEDALASFALKPVTDNHPTEDVTAENARRLAVGWSGETITRDGDYTRGTLLITDSAAIRKVESGKVEISLGYSVDLDLTPGTAPDGTVYDAVQRKIRGNHIALVDAGRCGGECRIEDQKIRDCGSSCDCASCRQNEESEMTDKPKAKLVDGVPVTTLDEAFEVIERKNKLIDEAKDSAVVLRDKYLAQQKDHAAAIEAKDAEIAKLTQQLSDSELDKRAEDRLNVTVKAADFLSGDYDTTGKSTIQIIKDAVSSALGADKVAGKSDDYVRAMFDSLGEEDAQAVSLGAAVTDRRSAREMRDNGNDARRKSLASAWRNTAGEKSTPAH